MRKISLLIPLFLMLSILSPTLSAAEKGKAYMGIYPEDVSGSYYEKIGLKQNYGILIKKVLAESPAEQAGLRDNDILMEIDGDKIFTHDQLTTMLVNYEPGQKVKLKIFREGNEKNIKITFGEREIPRIKKTPYMGVYLSELTNNVKKKLNYEQNYGIMITDLVEDGPAEKAGVKAKSVLMSLAGDKIYTIDQLNVMMKNYKPEDKVKIVVFQDNAETPIDMVLGEKANHVTSILNGECSFVFDKPENVFVYQFNRNSDKWIGVKLRSLENKTEGKDVVSVIIDEVIKDTPADRAGLKADDVILSIDGEKPEFVKSVSRLINKKEAGESVDLQIERDGEIINVKCDVAQREENQQYKSIQLSLDDGEITVWVNGEEKVLGNFDNLSGKLYETKHISQEELEKAMEQTQRELEKIEDLDYLKDLMEDLEDLQDLKIEIKGDL
ncbi:MAG TPA: PDZ domain-containing protein [Candidatus Cloacimonadota bacterium]|nr:PDZ domain-containing protein [Candidatus Cloacimonadota bacterium]